MLVKHPPSLSAMLQECNNHSFKQRGISFGVDQLSCLRGLSSFNSDAKGVSWGKLEIAQGARREGAEGKCVSDPDAT